MWHQLTGQQPSPQGSGAPPLTKPCAVHRICVSSFITSCVQQPGRTLITRQISYRDARQAPDLKKLPA